MAQAGSRTGWPPHPASAWLSRRVGRSALTSDKGALYSNCERRGAASNTGGTAGSNGSGGVSGSGGTGGTGGVMLCGNGELDEGELCEGDCPTSCVDPDLCTRDVLSGSAEMPGSLRRAGLTAPPRTQGRTEERIDEHEARSRSCGRSGLS